VRLVKIIKDGGYKGPVPVETILVRGVPYDPLVLVPEILHDLEVAIEQVYKVD
jgi:hypothetical protein